MLQAVDNILNDRDLKVEESELDATLRDAATAASPTTPHLPSDLRDWAAKMDQLADSAAPASNFSYGAWMEKLGEPTAATAAPASGDAVASVSELLAKQAPLMTAAALQDLVPLAALPPVEEVAKRRLHSVDDVVVRSSPARPSAVNRGLPVPAPADRD